MVTGSRNRLSNRVLARDEERPASSTPRGAPRREVGAVVQLPYLISHVVLCGMSRAK